MPNQMQPNQMQPGQGPFNPNQPPAAHPNQQPVQQPPQMPPEVSPQAPPRSRTIFDELLEGFEDVFARLIAKDEMLGAYDKDEISVGVEYSVNKFIKKAQVVELYFNQMIARVSQKQMNGKIEFIIYKLEISWQPTGHVDGRD